MPLEKLEQIFLEGISNFTATGGNNLPLYVTGNVLTANVRKTLIVEWNYTIYTKKVIDTSHINLSLEQWALVDYFVALHSQRFVATYGSSFSEMLHQ